MIRRTMKRMIDSDAFRERQAQNDREWEHGSALGEKGEAHFAAYRAALARGEDRQNLPEPQQ